MKNSSIILLILGQLALFAGCKNTVQKNSTPQKNATTDTVSTAKTTVHKYGENILKSKPFTINGMQCYWQQTDTVTDEGSMDLIKLKDYKTHRILVNHIECCLKYGFDFDAPENFLDVNFDGYKDFLIRSYGSMAAFEVTNIYLFNPKEKQFIPSDLSDNIITADSIHRRLITSSFDRDYEKTQTHYFDRSGKLKYTEIETAYTTPSEYKIFEKVVNGRVVKRDSL